MPIGGIVAVAIVCIVVAVLSSARRADDVAVGHEQQMFNTALANVGERMLRDIESVARSDGAIRNIRDSFDVDWTQQHIGGWLDSTIEHDGVIVFDPHGTPIFSRGTDRARPARWLTAARLELEGVLATVRGSGTASRNALRLDRTDGEIHGGVAIMRRLLGRPAIIAAALVATPQDAFDSRDTDAPMLMSVKFIDSSLIGQLAGQLHISNLRLLPGGPAADDDFVDTVHAPDGSIIARFVWTPKRPGSDIVHSVAPFITVPLAGFAMLAAFVLRYMRRTAATIAAG